MTGTRPLSLYKCTARGEEKNVTFGADSELRGVIMIIVSCNSNTFSILILTAEINSFVLC